MQNLLEIIQPIADENGMEARIDGIWSSVEDEWSDGRLLKICPKGIRSIYLLQVEAGKEGYKLYKHRTKELTERYKGRQIDQDWIIGFIKNNASFAAEIVTKNPLSKPDPDRTEATTPLPYSDKEIERKRKEKHTISCPCRGVSEDCARCFGSGFFEADGFGKRI